jgi:YVTN family beta-propeller protein
MPQLRPAPVAPLRPAALLLAAGLAAAAGLAQASVPKAGPPAREGVPAVAEAARPGGAPAVAERFVADGIAVELTIEALDPEGGAGGAPVPLREGQDALVRLRLSDTASGSPLSGANPAAWMDHLVRTFEGDARGCKEKVQDLVGGSLFAQAEIDLNVFYVLALNDDATVSVVDPRFHFGDSKLLTMLVLEAPGEDWVLSKAWDRLFISMPETGRVAVADTRAWKVTESLEAGVPAPRRVALQPDERYLWVTYPEGAGGRPGGVVVFDARDLERLATIETGRGRHELAFGHDSRHAFVTNRDDGTLAVIDVRSLEVVARLETGSRPTAVAYSPLSRTVYVAHEGDGTIAVVDAAEHRLRARMEAEPGLGQIRFTPGGRFGLVVNPAKDLFHVFDAATNRIVQTADSIFGSHPDQVVFSDELAYVRHGGSEILVATPLDALGEPGRPVSLMDVSGGQSNFDRGASPSPADGLVQAPGDNAVLIANPADRAIYYYREGMAAPMGSFQNYGRQPRALLVVDRSLRERAPGSYETVAKLVRPGRYELAFFLDSPQIVHCFDVTVEADSERAAERLAARPAEVAYLVPGRRVEAGRELRLRVALTRPGSGEPIRGLTDVQVMAYRPPGRTQYRRLAREVGDGVYEVELAFGEPGFYSVYTQVPSLGLPFRAAAPFGLEVVEELPAAEPRADTAAGGGRGRADP